MECKRYGCGRDGAAPAIGEFTRFDAGFEKHGGGGKKTDDGLGGGGEAGL